MHPIPTTSSLNSGSVFEYPLEAHLIGGGPRSNRHQNNVRVFEDALIRHLSIPFIRSFPQILKCFNNWTAWVAGESHTRGLFGEKGSYKTHSMEEFEKQRKGKQVLSS